MAWMDPACISSRPARAGCGCVEGHGERRPGGRLDGTAAWGALRIGHGPEKKKS